MPKCIYIEVSDDGQASVGLKPEGIEIPPEVQMQPAGSVDEALEMGREMLGSDPEMEAQNEEAFSSGYEKAGGLEALNTRGMK